MDFARGQYTIIEQPFKHGGNLWVGSYVHIRPSVSVGSDVEIRDGVWIGPGATIGSRVRIMNKSIIAADQVIHNDVFIGPGVCFTNARVFTAEDLSAPVVQSGVRVGARAAILPGVILAEGCVIGAGALVTKSTEPYRMYFGTPARDVGPVELPSIGDELERLMVIR